MADLCFIEDTTTLSAYSADVCFFYCFRSNAEDAFIYLFMYVWLAYYFQCACQFVFKHVFNVALKVVLQELLCFFRYQQVDSGEFQIKQDIY